MTCASSRLCPSPCPRPRPRLHLVFIRTPSTESIDDDPYERAARTTLDSGSTTTTHLPILDTDYVNIEQLHQIISRDDEDPYDGIIITSSRSVQALALAQQRQPRSIENEKPDLVSRIPIFVVGQGTANALWDKLPRPPRNPGSILGNDGTTGNGDKLATFILRHFDSLSPEHHPEIKRRFLFLTGDKNRETIPTLIQNHGWSVEKLQVYRTKSISTPRIEAYIQRIQANIDRDLEHRSFLWLVFFSPSGAKASIPSFRSHGWIRSNPESMHERDRAIVRIATIGPTTSSYLKDEQGLIVDAEAETPDAQDLIRAIQNASSIA